MTKYILHGGMTSLQNENNDNFFRAFINSDKIETIFILNYFAKPDEKTLELFEEDKKRIQSLHKSIKINFVLAEPNYLTEQLQSADGMYMRGGDTRLLKEKLSLTYNLKYLFANKTIAGSSAGVNVLTKYYWSDTYNTLNNGLDIINIKAYCHYKNNDEKDIATLLKHKENIPLIVLPECEWTIIEG